MPRPATLDAFFLAALLAPPAPHNLQLDELSPPRLPPEPGAGRGICAGGERDRLNFEDESRELRR